MPLKTNKIYNIPVEATLDVIGGKWKTLILCHLTHEPKRSGQLRKLMPLITQKMLTQQLKELEGDGLITRTVFHEVPLKVVYELSELGWSLKPILYHMCDWGEKLMKNQLSSPSSINETGISSQ